jgi:hypothetical protein
MTFGEVSWGEDQPKTRSSNNKDVFLRLDDGSNKIRIITKPFVYESHKYKKAGEKGFGQKVGCSKTETTDCVLCGIIGEDGKPSRPQRRWFIGVIERKTGTAKVLDISYAVKQQIDALSKDPEFGDPSGFDMDLKVNRNGGASGYYMIVPRSPSPLSGADQVLRDNFDVEDLRRRCQPLTPDQVAKRIERIDSGLAWGEKPAAGTQASAAKAPPAKASSKKPAPPPVEDSGDEFPEV